MFVVRDWTRNPSYTMVSNDVNVYFVERED